MFLARLFRDQFQGCHEFLNHLVIPMAVADVTVLSRTSDKPRSFRPPGTTACLSRAWGYANEESFPPFYNSIFVFLAIHLLFSHSHPRARALGSR